MSERHQGVERVDATYLPALHLLPPPHPLRPRILPIRHLRAPNLHIYR